MPNPVEKPSDSINYPRYLAIAEHILSRPKGSVTRWIMDEYGVSHDTAARYQKSARELIKDQVDKRREDWISEHLSLTIQLYNEAEGAGKVRDRLSVLQYEASLLGLEFGTREMIDALVAKGYRVYRPDSAEEQAYLAEARSPSTEQVIDIQVLPPVEDTEDSEESINDDPTIIEARG